jgi:hypothetical protein
MPLNSHDEERIKLLLSKGHSKKAESEVNKLVVGMSLEDLKSAEPDLRRLSSDFLPTNKARHRRIDDLISRQLAARPLVARDSSLVSAVTPSLQHTIKHAAARPCNPIATDAEETEFRALVAEVRALGFTSSKQVSNYIMARKLGNKYGHISGRLTMERDGDQWPFYGGIQPRIYARLCNELGLDDQGTDARPGEFIPFRDLS